MNRSPACAAILRAEGINVTSKALKEGPLAGCAAKKMREAMAARGYDLTGHVPETVTQAHFRHATLVVYMDGGNLRRIQNLPWAVDERKLHCLAKWGPLGLEKRVPDPAFMPADSPQFAAVVELIVEASRRLAQEIGLAR